MTEYYDVDRVVGYVEKKEGYIAIGNGFKRGVETCECGGSCDKYGRCDWCGKIVEDSY